MNTKPQLTVEQLFEFERVSVALAARYEQLLLTVQDILDKRKTRMNESTDCGNYPPNKETAEFILRSHTDIPPLVAEIRRLQANSDPAEETALRILMRITCAMNLKDGEDPEWEHVGQWIALGKAIEEMPLNTQLRHKEDWDEQGNPIHYWQVTGEDTQFIPDFPTPLEALQAVQKEQNE